MLRRVCIILSYHHIAEASECGENMRYYVKPREFERQMEYLHKKGYTVLDIGELADIIRKKAEIPAGAVVITFDDAFKSVAAEAEDILALYGFRAAVFVSTGKVGGINDWDTGVRDDIDILSWEDILGLSSSVFSFHSHGVGHRALTSLEDDAIMDELVRSKEDLASRLGDTRYGFCYPFSDFDEKVRNLAEQAGYDFACTSRPGINDKGSDIFLLKRVEVTWRDTLNRFIFKVGYNRLFGSSKCRL